MFFFFNLTTDEQLTILNVTKRHAGIFQCFVSNSLSKVDGGAATLEVVPRSKVASSPSSSLTSFSDEEDDDDPQSSDEEDTPPILFEYVRPSEIDSIQRSADFYHRMNQRRSVRSISSDPVPLEVIQNIVKTGGKFFFLLGKKKELNS